LISENQRDDDDIKHFYNPDLGSSFHHHDYLHLRFDEAEEPYDGDEKLSKEDMNKYNIASTSASNDVLNNQVQNEHFAT